MAEVDRCELPAGHDATGAIRMSGPVTVLCPECGDLTEVNDVPNLLRALHTLNVCSIRSLVGGPPDDQG